MPFECEAEAEELLLLALLIALALIKGRTLDEINVLGNFTAVIGSLLLTYSAEAQFLKTQSEQQETEKNDLAAKVDELTKRVEELAGKMAMQETI